MIITTSSLMPSGYRVSNIEVTFPMGLVTACHLLWPFVLNPWFISFSVSLVMNGSYETNGHSFRRVPFCTGTGIMVLGSSMHAYNVFTWCDRRTNLFDGM